MISPARQEPIRIGAPSAPASSTAVDAAAVCGVPALRALLRGEEELARAIVAAYDNETIDTLAAAADRLGVLCREIRGTRS